MLINRMLFTGFVLLIISSSSSGQNYKAGWSAYSGGFNRSGNAGMLLSSVTGQTFANTSSSGHSRIMSGFLAYSVAALTDLGNNEMHLPDKFELSQNYPNPLNPSTKIEYTIAEKSNITLKVYNLLGSEVVQLVYGEAEAGRYSVEFNASGLASGVYFYTLQAGNFVQTKKMIVLK